MRTVRSRSNHGETQRFCWQAHVTSLRALHWICKTGPNVQRRVRCHIQAWHQSKTDIWPSLASMLRPIMETMSDANRRQPIIWMCQHRTLTLPNTTRCGFDWCLTCTRSNQTIIDPNCAVVWYCCWQRHGDSYNMNQTHVLVHTRHNKIKHGW